MSQIAKALDWQPEAGWGQIDTIEMHTGGAPLRVIVSGLPKLVGRTVLEKRRWFADNLDPIRTALMFEPRGHADMYGAVLTDSEDADFDVFFLHNEGYSTMCGHAMLALSRLAVETGLVPAGQTEMTLNVPAGRIEAWVDVEGGKVRMSHFRNVPSYVPFRDVSVDVPSLGSINVDVAYGGAYYAIVDAVQFGVGLRPSDASRLIELGDAISGAVARAYPVEHPTEPDLSFLYGTIFTGPAEHPAHHSRNVCIFADRELDRSPTGSGVSARAALHHARGELALNESIIIESILGSTMSVRAVETCRMGANKAIVPVVSGTAHFTGRNSFWIEPDDALGDGFLVR